MADQRKNPFIQKDIDEPKKVLQGSIKRLNEETVVIKTPEISKQSMSVRTVSKADTKQKNLSTDLPSNSAFGNILGNPGGKTKKTLMTGVIAVVVTSLVSIPANAVEPMIPAQSVIVDENGIIHNVVPETAFNSESGTLNKVSKKLPQTLTTPEGAEPTVLSLEVEATIDQEVVAREAAEKKAREEAEAAAAAEAARIEAEEAAAAQRANEEQAQQRSHPQASGEGRSDIANAAATQLGVTQDCTDLVQYALASVGINATRANGGYDFGTAVHEYTQFGGQVVNDGMKPGDILVWPGYHVAVYFGDGQIVHGGWNGDQTVKNDWLPSGYTIVRF